MDPGLREEQDVSSAHHRIGPAESRVTPGLEMVTGDMRMGTMKRNFTGERTKGVHCQFLITEEDNGRTKPKIFLENRWMDV